MKNCCESIIKYFIVLCNILFALAGIVLIGFGAYLQVAAKNYLFFHGDKYVITPILFIILGGVIFIIALFGCCGACQENKCLLNTYCIVLLFIFIAQIAAGIGAFALQGYLKDEISKNMKNSMWLYGANGFEGFTTTWDLVQKEFSCCGVQNYGDWKNVNQFVDGGVPNSCCKGCHQGCEGLWLSNGREDFYDPPDYDWEGVETCGKDTNKIFTQGCFSPLSNEFKSKFIIIGAIALAIAVGEMITIVFACCLGRRVGHGGPYVVELDPYTMAVTL